MPPRHKDTSHIWTSKKIIALPNSLQINFFFYSSFREFVSSNPVQKLLSVEEFKKYREEVRNDIGEKGDDEAPPGLDEGMCQLFP